MSCLKKVILVSGFCRTGKDTFYTKLANENNKEMFNWRIYKNPSKRSKKIDRSLRYIRCAFADSLKEDEAPLIYGIPPSIPDSEKDIKKFIHYKTGKLVSARDIYIELGKMRRKEDIDYWCKAASKKIGEQDENTCWVVTDWRFHNEADFIINNYEDVITIRLYRSDVPQPDLCIDSEHNIDDYLADFLLLRDNVEGEFESAISVFPQYSNYIPCETI